MHSQLVKASSYLLLVFLDLVGKRPQVKTFRGSHPLSNTAFSNHRLEYIFKPLLRVTIVLIFLSFNSKVLSKVFL